MKLTRVERWIISNQFQILEKIHPEEAEYYEKYRHAIISGFEGEYETAARHVDRKELSEAECTEVMDILAMFQALKDSDPKLPEKDMWKVKFAGFDANHDPQFSYCRWLIEEAEHFPDLLGGKNPNSHSSTSVGQYRRQLELYKSWKGPYKLSAEQVAEIAAAAIPPQNRGPVEVQ